MNIKEFCNECVERKYVKLTHTVKNEDEITVISFLPNRDDVCSLYHGTYTLTKGKDVEEKPSLDVITDEEYDFTATRNSDNSYLISLSKKKIGNQNIRHDIYKDLLVLPLVIKPIFKS